ncbi:C1A family cysteine protease [Paraburkholderia sp. WSM4175]|uniref:C1 family peptidase n=1 Tax=Paraburkholderia sp. WSM4175 TaxID=2991072 RepID=UPI003D1D6EBA
MNGKQIRRICNLVPSKDTERDWRLENALEAGSVGAVAALPPSCDLRAPWWAVGDQGATGSCVGWGSTDGVMRYHLVKAGKLGQGELLSPRYTWMASKETDTFVARPETFIEEAGTSLKAAMDICRNYGVVPDGLLPFDINTLMYTGNENQFYATAAQRRSSAYFNLGKDLNQWRTWLASHGPILVGVNVDATWDNATATNGKLDTFQPSTVRGGHAPCVVGYTQDQRFIIRNSWGNGWGDKGFAYASEAYINAGFFNESYGITV